MADIPNDIFFASIGEIGAKLRAKEFSCVELTRAFCDRFERIAPRYNAMALSLRDQAVRQAKDVDSELKRGRTRGALQGIPYGAKDLISVKDRQTAWGARPYAGQIFKEDAAVIENLDGAKAILIGKLAMISLAGVAIISMLRPPYRGRAATHGIENDGAADRLADPARPSLRGLCHLLSDRKLLDRSLLRAHSAA